MSAAYEPILTRRRRPKRPATIATDRSRITAHIAPMLGTLPVNAVTRQDVERMMHAVMAGKTRRRTKLPKLRALSNVRDGTGAASRTVSMLHAVMAYAVRLGLRSDNPVSGIVRPADGRRDRRLLDEEYAAFGTGLVAAEDDGAWMPALAAIRFLLVTGWRRGEVLGLRWAEVDLSRCTARLSDTKTGASTRPLAEAACAILRGVSRDGTYVFKAPGGDMPMGSFASGRGWCIASQGCRRTSRPMSCGTTMPALPPISATRMPALPGCSAMPGTRSPGATSTRPIPRSWPLPTGWRRRRSG